MTSATPPADDPRFHFDAGSALLAAQDAEGAAAAYREAARLRPDWADAAAALGWALLLAGDIDGAIEAYRRTLQLDPAHVAAALNLTQALRDRGRTDEAHVVLTAAVQRLPHHTELLRRLGGLECQRGELEPAIAAFRRILALQPDHFAAWSDLLMCLNYAPGMSAAALLAEHKRFGERLAANVQRLPPRPPPDRARRPLRIGYVSPDFRRHPTSCFLTPLLEHHDRERVEVYAYYDHLDVDPSTEYLQTLVDAWRDIAEAPDEAVAAQVADDGIDVLVDLNGHTAGGRLGVFARKPAPVQMTWLGYPCTTGLRAIDYRLCDHHTDPEGVAEAQQVETPLRLPRVHLCYQPLDPMPPPGPLPFLGKGHWTFGSFNQPLKINAPVLDAWAQVLHAFPGSRFQAVALRDPAAIVRVREGLVARGVTLDRLHLRGRLFVNDYYESFGSVDVALDTWPYNGCTTTCDALLAGVPVLTVAGERANARVGLSLLATLGLDPWVAPSVDAMAEHLRELLREPARVAALRAALPARMRASPLMDGAAFAGAVEAQYQAAWQNWCDGQRVTR